MKLQSFCHPISVLGLLAFFSAPLFAASVADDLAQQVQNALTDARVRAVQEQSPVTLRLTWRHRQEGLNQFYRQKTVCRGALVNGGTRVITHRKCITPHEAAGYDYVIASVELFLSNGKSWKTDAPAQPVGRFAYFEANPALTGGLAAATVRASTTSTVKGLFEKGVKMTKQSVYFDGATRTISQVIYNGTFTVAGLWQKRAWGEPVFLGADVVALNSGDEPFTGRNGADALRQRTLLEAFTAKNGGAELAK